MNSRYSFHRAQQWQLAERQRYLNELESLAERLRVDAERLSGEIDFASAGHAVTTNAGADPMFLRPLLDRHEKLVRSIAEIDAQIVEAQDAVLTAQQETRLVEGGIAQRGLQFEERLTRRARRSI